MLSPRVVILSTSSAKLLSSFEISTSIIIANISQVLAGAPGREERIAKSQQYVKRFEGNNVAQKVLDVYNKLI